MRKASKPIKKKDLSPFNRKLIEARKAKGLSKAELSKITGISTSYISYLERNPALRASFNIAIKLANALDVSEEYLMRDEIKEGEQDINDSAFFNSYRRLSKKNKEYMRKIIKCFE